MFWTNFTIKKEFVQFFINNSMRISKKKGNLWVIDHFYQCNIPYLPYYQDDSQKPSSHYYLNAKISTGIQADDRQRDWQVMTSRIKTVRVFGL
jgi:hypothetical protein